MPQIPSICQWLPKLNLQPLTSSPKFSVTWLANRHLKPSILAEVFILTLHPHSQHLPLMALVVAQNKNNKESSLISLSFTCPVICQSYLFYLQNIPLLHLLPSPLVNASPSHYCNGLPLTSISLFFTALRVIFYDANHVMPFSCLKLSLGITLN